MRPALLIAALLLAPDARAQTPYSFAWLEALVRSHGASSAATLVSSLPPEMRSRVAVVHRSRSPFPSSWRHPRLIFFAPGSRLILTVQGKPVGAPPSEDDELVEVAEVMHPGPTSRPEVHGRLIRFSPRNRDVEFIRDAMSYFPRTSPKHCGHCHLGNERAGRFRWIWDEYRTWPGMFGTHHYSVPPEEAALFARFTEAAAGDPLYVPVLRGLSPRGLAASNVEFTDELSALNALVINHDLRSSPRYPRFRRAVTRALRLSDPYNTPGHRVPHQLADLREHLPVELRARFDEQRESYLAWAREQTYLASQSAHQRADEALGRHGRYQRDSAFAELAQGNAMVKFVADAMGVATGDWGLSLERYFSFTDSAQGTMHGVARLRRQAGHVSACTSVVSR